MAVEFSISTTNPVERLEAYLAASKSFELLYEAGKNTGDEAKMQEARDLHTELVSQLESDGNDYCQMFQIMERAYMCKRDIPDLHDCIFEKNVPALVATFRKFGVKCFTVSSGYSGMNETIWAFTQQPGVRLMGMTQIVADPMTHFGKKEPDKVPAFLLYID